MNQFKLFPHLVWAILLMALTSGTTEGLTGREGRRSDAAASSAAVSSHASASLYVAQLSQKEPNVEEALQNQGFSIIEPKAEVRPDEHLLCVVFSGTLKPERINTAVAQTCSFSPTQKERSVLLIITRMPDDEKAAAAHNEKGRALSQGLGEWNNDVRMIKLLKLPAKSNPVKKDDEVLGTAIARIKEGFTGAPEPRVAAPLSSPAAAASDPALENGFNTLFGEYPRLSVAEVKAGADALRALPEKGLTHQERIFLAHAYGGPDMLQATTAAVFMGIAPLKREDFLNKFLSEMMNQVQRLDRQELEEVSPGLHPTDVSRLTPEQKIQIVLRYRRYMNEREGAQRSGDAQSTTTTASVPAASNVSGRPAAPSGSSTAYTSRFDADPSASSSGSSSAYSSASPSTSRSTGPAKASAAAAPSAQNSQSSLYVARVSSKLAVPAITRLLERNEFRLLKPEEQALPHQKFLCVHMGVPREEFGMVEEACHFLPAPHNNAIVTVVRGGIPRDIAQILKTGLGQDEDSKGVQVLITQADDRELRDWLEEDPFIKALETAIGYLKS